MKDYDVIRNGYISVTNNSDVTASVNAFLGYAELGTASVTEASIEYALVGGFTGACYVGNLVPQADGPYGPANCIFGDGDTEYLFDTLRPGETGTFYWNLHEFAELKGRACGEKW